MTTPAPPPNGQPQTVYRYGTDEHGVTHMTPNPAYPGPVPEVPATFQPQPPVPLPAYEQPAAAPQLADQNNAAPQIPEGGYAQRIIRIPLPQFRLEGLPEPWVDMRNPGLMSQDALDEISRGFQGQTADPDGEPDEAVVMATLTRLVRRWCMWDGNSEDDVPPLLPEQVDVAGLRRAPVGVLMAVMKTVKELQDPQ